MTPYFTLQQKFSPKDEPCSEMFGDGSASAPSAGVLESNISLKPEQNNDINKPVLNLTASVRNSANLKIMLILFISHFTYIFFVLEYIYLSIWKNMEFMMFLSFVKLISLYFKVYSDFFYIFTKFFKQLPDT